MGGRFKAFLAGGVAGALAAYYFDPDRGHSRRTTTRDQLFGKARDVGRKAERAGRALEAEAEGAYMRLTHRTPETPADEYDDVTLTRKVESELFASDDFPKGSININVVDGVVELRGQVRTPDDIKAIEERVRKIHGVEDVHNLLHLPKRPAPNKRQAREAG
jgi:osmotically-inducible protein OsmY